jgi:Pro-kumamolisin, activation domain/IPT/TIG domain
MDGRRMLCTAAALAALALAVAAPVVIDAATAAGQDGLVRIGAVPRLPRGAVDLGSAPSGATISGAVVLRPRDATALASFIGELTTKGSPLFGQRLSKGQFAARFGPATGTIAKLRTRLTGDGVRVLGVASDGLLVRFAGPAARVAQAFATGLERYRLANGRLAQATISAPALPAPIAGAVATVVGLDALGRPHPLRIQAKRSQRRLHGSAKAGRFPHPEGSPRPCSAAKRDAREEGGLTDDQIANAYGAFGLYALGDVGSGVHVGIFEQEPFVTSDIQHFDTCYFDAASAASMIARLSVIPVEVGSTSGPGEGEASLDVEDTSAIAPGANIDVYDAPESLAGELSEITAMVDEDRDQIITSSWGEPCEQEAQAGQPGVQQAENYLFQQAAAQGQTFLNAAGDTGSDACEEAQRELVAQPGQNPVSTTELASQPYVLAVGGTTITNAATQPAREHVWNDGPEGGGGGGGISQSWAMPSWQRDATIPGIALPGSADYTNAAAVQQRFGYSGGFCDSTLPAAEATTPCRLVPDVAAQADEYTGAPTVYSEASKGTGEEQSANGWTTTGGTSSASPIWAATLALADASPTCKANPATASGVGFVSPLLYAIASEPSAYAASFNDITEGNNDVYGLDGGKVFPATPGYDLATGLGSPRLTGPDGSAGLAYYLCSAAQRTGGPVVTGLTPGFGTTAGGESVEVTGTGFARGATSQVATVQVGAWHAAASAIQVLGPGELTVTMPPARDTLPAGAPASQDGAGPVEVIVTLTNGQSSAPGPAATFDYQDASSAGAVPSVTGLSPSGGNDSAPAPVTILGADFTGTKSVSFGGVDAATFKLLSDSQIRVTPPPYSSHTVCAPLPSTGVYAGENAGNDICQAQVVVHGADGASATATILAPFEGAESFEQDGALQAPPGCGCEVYPATTEFDYAPAPTITSVSSAAGPASLASETGETLVTVHGTGLSRFSFDYAFFGEPGLESSVDYGIAFASGTELQIAAPALAESAQTATVAATSLPFSVRTLAGDSQQVPVQYAGVPTVSSVESAASAIRLKGMSGALDTGGTPIVVTGKGMLGQVTDIRFEDSLSPQSEGTNYAYDAASGTRLTTQTVSQNPALANVQVCTVTGCSAASHADLLFLYPPGQPDIESLAPHSGSAAGATNVLVRGENLGCPLAVAFGANTAASFTPAQALLACSATSELEVRSPPGEAGTKVPVTATTAESYFTGSGDAPTKALFTYTAP